VSRCQNLGVYSQLDLVGQTRRSRSLFSERITFNTENHSIKHEAPTATNAILMDVD
jgi:hypothetical protein